MFNLFKKKQQEPRQAPEPPKPEYVPEKPVVELFEAVKDVAYFAKAGDLTNVPSGHLVRHAISFTFKGMDFTAYEYRHDCYLYADVGLLNSTDYGWLTHKELDWLYTALCDHLKAKKQEQLQKKRQEFIGLLGG